MLVAARWRPQRGTRGHDRRGAGRSPRVFRDREEAGRALAAALHGRVERAHALVLAIPRGGVIVAAPVARALDAPLDVVIPHKLGAPRQPRARDRRRRSRRPRPRRADRHARLRVPAAYIEDEVAAQEAEIERRTRLYRGDRPAPVVRRTRPPSSWTTASRPARPRWRRCDGRARKGRRAWCSPRPWARGRRLGCSRPSATTCVVLETPPSFRAVGEWYERFDQVEDEQVLDVLGDGS